KIGSAREARAVVRAPARLSRVQPSGRKALAQAPAGRARTSLAGCRGLADVRERPAERQLLLGDSPRDVGELRPPGRCRVAVSAVQSLELAPGGYPSTATQREQQSVGR